MSAIDFPMHEEDEEGEEFENGELVIDEDEQPRPLSALESEVDVMGGDYLIEGEEQQQGNLNIETTKEETEKKEETETKQAEETFFNNNHSNNSNGYDNNPLRLLSSAAAAEHEQRRKISQ